MHPGLRRAATPVCVIPAAISDPKAVDHVGGTRLIIGRAGDSGGELEFHSPRRLDDTEGRIVALEIAVSGFNLRASTRVKFTWNVAEGTGDGDRLVAFFKDMAGSVAGNLPWEGQKTFESGEGDLSLRATCSQMGLVLLKCTLCRPFVEDWSASVTVKLEAGTLDEVAARLGGFLQAV